MVRRPTRSRTSKPALKRPARKARKAAAEMAREVTRTRREGGAPGRGGAARGTRQGPAEVPIEVPEGWTVEDRGKRITVQVKTRDFLDALDVMNEVGRVAEELQHHPDLHLERYNRLRITTYSHDVGRLTDRDERLAERVGEVLEKRGLGPA